MEAVFYARAFFYRQVFIEAAGLFWIGAELGILFAVLLARHRLETRNWRPPLRLDAGEKRRAAAWTLGFVVLCAAVFGRHAWLPQVHHLLGDTLPPERLTEVLQRRHREHMGLWAAFVTAWVLLEAAIVYHGWRAYCTLRRVLRAPGDTP